MGMQIDTATIENSMEVPSKTEESYHTTQQSHSQVYTQKTIIRKDSCTSMFIAYYLQ